jgi:hypothetical protein
MRLAVFAVAAVLSASLAARADTLASYTVSTDFSYNVVLGQSVTVSGAGAYSDIAFSLIDSNSNDYAVGTGYFFSSPYTGTIAGLSSSDPGYLGSAAASGGAYSFGSSMTLTAGQTYYFYENAAVPYPEIIVGGDTYSGSTYFAESDPQSDFTTAPSGYGQDFILTGDPVSATPEPSTILLLGTGLLGVASKRRSRFA